MEVLEAIFTRRSIRKYTGEPISEEDLKTVLQAGFSAPSAHNLRPWHFIVIRDKNTINSIAEMHPYAKMLPQAGCAVIVCGDETTQDMLGFLVADCSAAIQNMLLAAHGLGLGAVWCGLFPHQELTRPISDMTDLPATVTPVGMVVIGHKAEEKKSSDRFDQSKVHMEKW